VIIDWLVQEFKNDEGANLKDDPMAMQRLKEAAEKAKIELSSSTSTEINLPYIMPVGGVPKHLVKTLTRAKFEQLAHDLIQACLAPCQKAIADAKLTTADIDEVILVGGSSRIPAVQTLVKNYFGKEPSKGVNPDEVVAVGASIQGAILNKEGGVGDIVLLDVTPLTLGVETVGGVMTPIIERNSYIPVKKTKTFSTISDGQLFVNITIYEGERAMVKDNNQLGQFQLDGIPSLPRGQPQIEVTFELDANGILTVSATEKSSGSANEITIKNDRNRLSEEQIQKMVEEASQHAEEDKREREIADLRTQLQQLIYDAKDKLDSEKDGSILDIISDDDKDRLEETCDDVQQWLDENDEAEKAEIQEKIDEFDSIVRPIIHKYVKKTKKAAEDKAKDADAAAKTAAWNAYLASGRTELDKAVYDVAAANIKAQRALTNAKQAVADAKAQFATAQSTWKSTVEVKVAQAQAEYYVAVADAYADAVSEAVAAIYDALG